MENPETLLSALEKATRALDRAGIDNPRLEARALAAGILKITREAMVARPEMEISADQTAALADGVRRRSAREPVARIVGEREFWSLPFVLGPDTLVPRPETETLVEAVLSSITDRDRPLSILDLGTGTGCLLLALLSEYTHATGLGIDCAGGAVDVAGENARRLGLDDRACFAIGDWGAGIDGVYDVIVSNPPYIATGERNDLSIDVRDHDPERALFAGADGLDAYRVLAPQMARLMAPGGIAVIEIGAGQGGGVGAIFDQWGLGVEASYADLSGHERALFLTENSQKCKAINVKKKVGKEGIPV